MAESLNLSVGPMEGGERPGKFRPLPRILSLGEALDSIGRLPVSKEQKAHLGLMAKKVPSGSLGNFVQNYKSHLKKSE